MTRRFQLFRHHDVSGVSGVGVVADGACFPDGSCVMRWRGELRSWAIYEDIAELEAIHGHDGNSEIVWVD